MMDEMIFRNALLEMQEYLVSQFPEPTEEDEKIPFRLRHRIKGLIEKHDHPIWYSFKKSVAVAALALLLVISVFLSSNENARADVWEWIKERFPIFARDAIEIPMVEDYYPYLMDYSKEGIFYYVLQRNETFEYDFYFQSYSGKKKDTCLFHREGGYMKDLSAVRKKDGMHYCVLWVDDEAGYISEYDARGRLIKELKLKDSGFEIPGNFPMMLSLSEGGYLIGLVDKVYYVSGEGDFEHIFSIGEGQQIRNFVTMENGRKFAVYQDLMGSEMRVAELDLEREMAVATKKLPVFEERITALEGNKLAYCANDAAYSFEMNGAEDEMLIDLKGHNLVATQIEGVYDDGSYFKLVSVDKVDGGKRIRVLWLNKRAEKKNIADATGKNGGNSAGEGGVGGEDGERIEERGKGGEGIGTWENGKEIGYDEGEGGKGKGNEMGDGSYAPDGRRIIRVAVPADEPNAWVIEYRARKYSQESTSLIVEVVRYDGTPEEYLAGNCPDIVMLHDHTEIGPLAKSGVLTDLNPLCEKRDRYTIEDLIPKAREALSVGDGLYALGQTFRLLLRTSDGTEYFAEGAGQGVGVTDHHAEESGQGMELTDHHAEELGQGMEVTGHHAEEPDMGMEEAGDAVERAGYGADRVCTATEYLKWYDAYLDRAGVTGMQDLDLFFLAVLPDFYDEEEERAEFQSAEFKDLMRAYRSLRIKHEGEWKPFDAEYDLDLRIANKFAGGPIWVGELLTEMQLLNPDIRLAGIPKSNGEAVAYMKIERPLAILKSSDCKEEALDFILYACRTKTHVSQTIGGLTYESEENDEQTMGTFWVFEDYLKEDIWETKKNHCWSMWFVQPVPGMQFYGNGIEGGITQEHKEMLRGLMDGAVVVTKTQKDIYEMFLEEMEGYLNGDKELESCVDVLQKRVSLYLAE